MQSYSTMKYGLVIVFKEHAVYKPSSKKGSHQTFGNNFLKS